MGWEMAPAGVPGLGGGRPYVAIPAFGGGAPAARGAPGVIKGSPGARYSSWAGRWGAVCSDSCMWRGLGGVGAARARGVLKGFARRPQRLLEGLYVGIPAFGGEWEWEWEWEWGCARGGGARATNKGFARRPQEFLEGLYVGIPAFGGRM